MLTKSLCSHVTLKRGDPDRHVVLQLLAAVTDPAASPAKKAAVCKALAALCQDTQSGMRLASAWLSRLLLHLAMDAKAHHSLTLVGPFLQNKESNLANKAAVHKALGALCQDTQSGMRLASAWLSRLLLHLAMDTEAHHSLTLVGFSRTHKPG